MLAIEPSSASVVTKAAPVGVVCSPERPVDCRVHPCARPSSAGVGSVTSPWAMRMRELENLSHKCTPTDGASPAKARSFPFSLLRVATGPMMSVLRPGIVQVEDGGTTTRYFVQGGFADVTPDGLTILAEQALALDGDDKDALQNAVTEARSRVESETDEQKKVEAESVLRVLEEIL